MTKETKSKSLGWWKGVMSNQPSNEEEVLTEEVELDEYQPIAGFEEISTPYSLFSKDNQDKVSLDMIVALENMLKDRQLILYKNKGLAEQLLNEKDTTNRLKHDIMKKEKLLQEKNQEIHSLETNLTHKQMSYDQLLEDYKEYQNTSNQEFEKISNQLEKEVQKYNKLSEESTSTQYQNLLRINQLEEKIRELEVENQKYLEQYERILEEKNQLLQTIKDFTERMSFSFTPKTSSTQSE
ncbi:hypothetical protein SAMN05877753_101115 [Bacillus oleivorans]|uniref:Uncharacterized protein n=1 Tax=Bacillus oleivorans TaxID=1448271 RepID=A0A285CGU6_9BACI|nr:hypothetical protein [Bacillus oleivorans]SNX66804.1 hypothetical protein SAMN05877753_101115 [Bacillus oleivorans]